MVYMIGEEIGCWHGGVQLHSDSQSVNNEVRTKYFDVRFYKIKELLYLG